MEKLYEFNIGEDLKARIEMISKQTGESMNDLVHQALKEYFRVLDKNPSLQD